MTKLPWSAQVTAGGHQHLIWDESGKTIALVYTDESDTKLILKAVNAHDALVEALAELVTTSTYDARDLSAHEYETVLFEARKKAEAALSLAREG